VPLSRVLPSFPPMYQTPGARVASSCQTKSGCPSALKSATPTTFQPGEGPPIIVPLSRVLPSFPPMYQTPGARVASSCQMRSGTRSALKSFPRFSWLVKVECVARLFIVNNKARTWAAKTFTFPASVSTTVFQLLLRVLESMTASELAARFWMLMRCFFSSVKSDCPYPLTDEININKQSTNDLRRMRLNTAKVLF
jgi:hypothetical protein